MTIPLDELVSLYTGIPCDFDGYYGTQCPDPVHFYMWLVLGIRDRSVLKTAQAKDIILKYNELWNQYFDRVLYKKGMGMKPERGDVIVWNSGGNYGYNGHVAIVLEAETPDVDLWSFDANYYGVYPHRQWHNYVNCLGWLHPKNVNPITELDSALNTLRAIHDMAESAINK